MMKYAYLLLSHNRYLIDFIQFTSFVYSSLNRYIYKIIFLMSLGVLATSVSSQETPLQIASGKSKIEKLSDVKLLEQADNFRNTDYKKSIELAYKALQLSEKNNNYLTSAKAHILVADVAQKSNDVDLALYHSLQASLTYKKLNNTKNQIRYSLSHIKLLLKNKRYKQAALMVDELLPIALEDGKELAIASTLMVKGDIFYQQKNYDDAITYYMESLKYLEGNTQKAKKSIGRAYTKIAQSYKRLKNREKTAYFYKKALDVYTVLKDDKHIARTLNTIAEAERYLGNLVVALEYSMRGLEMHKTLNDIVGFNKSLVGAGIIYRNIGRYQKSREHFYEAHMYYKSIDDVHGIAQTSNQLGMIYTRLKQFGMAKSYYQLSIDLSKRDIEQNILATALREMAVIDLDSNHYKTAMIMANKAYEIYLHENNKAKASFTARIIANIYRGQQDKTNAINYYRKSLSLATESNSTIYKIRAQIALAGVLITTDTDEAVRLLKASIELSTKANNKLQMLYAYRKLLHAEKLRKNFTTALRYAEKEIALTAIIQKEKDDNKLILEKANLHSHKIEIELELLKEKASLDQMELAKKNSEIEIAEKTRVINELKFTKNQYASIALALLLAVCLLFFVLIYRRFIASKERNKELNYLVARDPLTNCYNRRVLLDIMERDFESSEQVDEYCIIMADIDYFKGVNDTYGHSVGDTVICGVSNILQSSVRQNDIVARYGGEEFCILLRQVSQAQATRIAENMRLKIEQSLFEDVSVTCSFGITSILFDAKTPIELINQADIALYRSKSLGRNQVTVWSQEFE